jgi:TolB-like protein
MKKNIFVVLLSLLFSLYYLFSEQIVLSVSDFRVESDNPSHRYIGKGLSRLVAFELNKSKAVKLLEREEIKKILEEQELSLSDLTDDTKQVKIGAMLSAEKIVFGEVIDMGNILLISLRMADIETGEIVWQDRITEKLETYDYIGAYFAKSILQELGAGVEDTTIQKIEKKEKKKGEAVIKISEGIDAYDKGDKEKAKKELEKAKKIDPESEVAKYYLSKIETISPKFRIETELYATTYNPASLGFIERDNIFFWAGGSSDPPNLETSHGGAQLVGDYWVQDKLYPGKIGYLFPVGQSLGFGLEVLYGGFDLKAIREDGSQIIDFNGTLRSGIQSFFNNIGGSIIMGYRILDNVSVGAAFSLYNTEKGEGSEVIVDEGVCFGIGGGLMIQGFNDNVTFDTHAAYTNQKIYYLDEEQQKIINGILPLVVEASITCALLNRTLFLCLKGIGDIYYDQRGGYSLRVIPIIEYWLFKFISLRAGYEYSHIDRADNFSMGHGILGGVTIKVWKFDLNANVTYREKPARMLPGYTVSNIKVLLGLTFYPNLFSR